MLQEQLLRILANEELIALFQPIVDLRNGSIIGYEGFVRGPADTALHFPLALLETAKAFHLKSELEHLCRKVVLTAFAKANLSGKLFLNVGPEWLLALQAKQDSALEYIEVFNQQRDRLVIELTEGDAAIDYDALRDIVTRSTTLGCQVAIDDLGEGFSNLRLWSELRPDYVKVDMHFIRGIGRDNIKRQFMRSMQDIARTLGTVLIAKGIETREELLTVRDLGIACGQGYHIGRPATNPAKAISTDLSACLATPTKPTHRQDRLGGSTKATARRLLRLVTPVAPAMTNNEVFDIFAHDPNLEVVPVVDNGVPVGLITRRHILDRFAAQFTRELHGRKPCTVFMDAKPFSVDQHTALQDLSRSVVEAERHHLFNGFIITDEGTYLGMGTGQDLIREITALQVSAARYANPLTGLPGNVPINENIDDLISSRKSFVVCYFDLDNFKPFNDFYGYRRGDDVIQLTGRILAAHADPLRDFVGHIGGDDFLILFQSRDWEARCRRILDAFASSIIAYFDDSDLERGGYVCEDRQGHKVLHPFITLSAGVVKAEPGWFSSHLQIAATASEAKKQAKRIAGNSMFVDRRTGPEID